MTADYPVNGAPNPDSFFRAGDRLVELKVHRSTSGAYGYRDAHRVDIVTTNTARALAAAARSRSA